MILVMTSKFKPYSLLVAAWDPVGVKVVNHIGTRISSHWRRVVSCNINMSLKENFLCLNFSMTPTLPLLSFGQNYFSLVTTQSVLTRKKQHNIRSIFQKGGKNVSMLLIGHCTDCGWLSLPLGDLIIFAECEYASKLSFILHALPV